MFLTLTRYRLIFSAEYWSIRHNRTYNYTKTTEVSNEVNFRPAVHNI